MSNRTSKAAYDPARLQISILPIQSSKGLEFKSVIFIGLGHLSKEHDEGESAKLLYVGMTRARQRLILTASADSPITEKPRRSRGLRRRVRQEIRRAIPRLRIATRFG